MIRRSILSAGALRMLRCIVAEAGKAGIPVSVCGEMAGRPLEAMALIGLGFRSLSMAASSIGPTRLMLRSLDAGKISHFIDAAVDGADPSLRISLANYARDHGVDI